MSELGSVESSHNSSLNLFQPMLAIDALSMEERFRALHATISQSKQLADDLLSGARAVSQVLFPQDKSKAVPEILSSTKNNGGMDSEISSLGQARIESVNDRVNMASFDMPSNKSAVVSRMNHLNREMQVKSLAEELSTGRPVGGRLESHSSAQGTYKKPITLPLSYPSRSASSKKTVPVEIDSRKVRFLSNVEVRPAVSEQHREADSTRSSEDVSMKDLLGVLLNMQLQINELRSGLQAFQSWFNARQSRCSGPWFKCCSLKEQVREAVSQVFHKMANIYVGFHDRKSCNRILKPPGGGTSDIFNTSLEKAEESEIKNTLILPETKPTVEGTDVNCPLNGVDLKAIDGKLESGENKTKSDSVAENSESPKLENLNINDENKKDEAQDKSEEKKDITEVKSPKSESISSVIHENQHQEKVRTPEKKVGQRVPPGGYSSGLW